MLKLNIKKKIKVMDKQKPAIFTLSIILVLILFLGWVAGKNYAGNINWLPVGSSFFGIPEEISEKYDVDLLIKNGDCGWDGQFYYYISNDILGTKGYSEFVDSPSYRWQRVGLPLAAKTLSSLHFSKTVSVYDYLIANLIILALGIYVFAKYMYEKKKSLLYILPWCLSVGVLITLKSFLPDSAADAFVIIAIIMLLKRKYIPYVLAMTGACLTREGYVAIAFFVFLWGFFGGLEKTQKYNFKFATLLAVPGIVFVLWYLYVTIKFGVFPFQQAHLITKLFLTEWPAVFIEAIQSTNILEFVGLIFYFITILFSFILAYILGKSDRRYWIFIPYIFLVGSFGNTVMKHWSGYLKGISFLFALIAIMMLTLKDEIKTTSAVNRGLVDFCFGCYFVFCLALSCAFVPQHAANMTQVYAFRSKVTSPVDYSNTNELQDFTGTIEIKDIEMKPYVSDTFTNLFTPENAEVILSIFNSTNQTWSKIQTKEGKYSINVGYQWFEQDNLAKVILEGRSNLINSIAPNTEQTEKLFLTYPNKRGNYILRISLVQEGVAWFWNRNGAYKDLLINIQ